MSGVKIGYGDVAPEAKENFVPTASESEFDTLSQLKEYNLSFENYANPCELYQTILNGEALAFPSVPEQANLGLWSEQVSNDDGTFTEPIVLTLTSEGQYSSQGLTLTFDTQNNIFPKLLNVKWYRTTTEGIETLANMDFEPDGSQYFCYNNVENYNKIVITFYSLNMPQNRLKVRSIDYGYGTFFFGDELRNVSVNQTVDPISSEITIDTVDFSLSSKRDIEYNFQSRQPITTYFNNKLIATTFVSSATREGKRQWKVQSNDYIGIMERVSFTGGMYYGKNAVELLEEIFSMAKVPFEIDEALANETVTGYISYTTCREALMQVAFALQCVVDTSGSGAVKVFYLDDEIKQTIPLKRIMQGQRFTDEDTLTRVDISAHTYTPISETVEVYSAEESGTGEEIKVIFSEPLHDLSIVNGDIVSRETNYAVINARQGCVLSGQKYNHTTVIKSKKNEVVLASEVDKITSITDATLVSANNVDKVLEKCYNWLVKNNAVNMKILEGKHIKYGNYIKYGDKKYGTFKYGGKHANIVTYDEPINLTEIVSFDTEYLGTITGRVYEQKFNLNGGVIIKEVAVK